MSVEAVSHATTTAIPAVRNRSLAKAQADLPDLRTSSQLLLGLHAPVTLASGTDTLRWAGDPGQMALDAGQSP